MRSGTPPKETHEVPTTDNRSVDQPVNGCLCHTTDAARHTDPGGVTLKFTVTLEKDEDGFFLVSCPTFAGCHSQGKTREEAITNIKEAIRGYVASLVKHGEPIPTTQVEEVEIAV